MTLVSILFRIESVKIWILLLTIHLVLGVLQNSLQFAARTSAVEVSEDHTHEYSFDEIFNLIWTGDVEHEHSHTEDSTHSHAHRHSLQVGSTVHDLFYSTFQFSYPEIKLGWIGLQPTGPRDPYSSEILRPPIRS